MPLRTKFKCSKRLKDLVTGQSYILFREDHKIFEVERTKNTCVQPTHSAEEQSGSQLAHGSRQSRGGGVKGVLRGIRSLEFKSHPIISTYIPSQTSLSKMAQFPCVSRGGGHW